ncbi:hypothetical protein [Sphingomonas sp. URHD0057]|uniref:hypothetical protein n=1 Tax=Sphingomonas sp. URHD0057 TaxID=1380389 RepID=UPI0012DF45D5|nr:hypothetical protein [Sphingomonas sp. URHD0057]
MKRVILCAAALAISACAAVPSASPTPVASLPGAAPVCATLRSDKFDLALQAYGAATDAVNLLIDARVLTPGSSKAVAIANANDKVLVAFATAEHARQACNSDSYLAALGQAQAAIAEIRAALHS